MDDNLQIDNGHYTRVHNKILEELGKIKLSGYEIRIILALWRKTYGWRKKEDFISFKQFEEMTRLPKSEISRTLSRLKKRNLVVENYNSNKRVYRFNKHFTTWRELEKSTTKDKRVVKIYNDSCRNLHKELEKSTTKNAEDISKNNKSRVPKETLTKETYTKEMILSQIENLKSQFPEDTKPLLMEYIEIAQNENKTGKIGLNKEKRLVNELLTEWIIAEADNILRDDFKQALRITVENEVPNIKYLKKVMKGLPRKRKVRLKKGYKKWK